MTGTRSAVAFTNRQNLKLFGIMRQPARHLSTDIAVVLLSPGVKMRVGPERLYVTMTETFVELGLPVLRFDFHGLGDSEGELSEELLRDVYNHIEVGRFVEDTVDAMDWLQKTYGTKRFILSGLCGGAITGLLTANRDPRVVGLLGLAITPVLASRSADPTTYMTAGQLADMRQTYIEKLLKPAAWLRLLTLKSDYRVIWRAIVAPWTSRRSRTDVRVDAPEGDDNANPLFAPAFFAMSEAQRPLLLIFGGSDRLRWEFEEKFQARHKERLESRPQAFEVHTIEAANHVLSFEPWQREMLDVSTSWFHRWFAKDVVHSAVPTGS